MNAKLQWQVHGTANKYIMNSTTKNITVIYCNSLLGQKVLLRTHVFYFSIDQAQTEIYHVACFYFCH